MHYVQWGVCCSTLVRKAAMTKMYVLYITETRVRRLLQQRAATEIYSNLLMLNLIV